MQLGQIRTQQGGGAPTELQPLQSNPGKPEENEELEPWSSLEPEEEKHDTVPDKVSQLLLIYELCVFVLSYKYLFIPYNVVWCMINRKLLKKESD